MAEEYGIKLKVTADTAEAKADIDNLLNEKQKRVQEAVGSSSGNSECGKLLPDAAAQRAGKAIGRSANKELESGTAGKAIGKAIAGFVLHQGIGTAFGLMREAGGNNVNIDRAQATAQGAAQYGMMGAMIGGPIGAAIGALVGGISGIVGQLEKERENYNSVRIGNWQTALGVNQGVAGNLGDMAKNRILGTLSSDQKTEYLASERAKIYTSLNAAQSRVERIAKGGDTSSTEYMYAQGEYNRLAQLYGKSLTAEFNDRLSKESAFESRDFSDSFSARGFSIGPQVDVAGVNGPLLERQDRANALLQQLVDLQREGSAADGSRLTQMLHAIKDATSL